MKLKCAAIWLMCSWFSPFFCKGEKTPSEINDMLGKVSQQIHLSLMIQSRPWIDVIHSSKLTENKTYDALTHLHLAGKARAQFPELQNYAARDLETGLIRFRLLPSNRLYLEEIEHFHTKLATFIDQGFVMRCFNRHDDTKIGYTIFQKDAKKKVIHQLDFDSAEKVLDGVLEDLPMGSNTCLVIYNHENEIMYRHGNKEMQPISLALLKNERIPLATLEHARQVLNKDPFGTLDVTTLNQGQVLTYRMGWRHHFQGDHCQQTLVYLEKNAPHPHTVSTNAITGTYRDPEKPDLAVGVLQEGEWLMLDYASASLSFTVAGKLIDHDFLADVLVRSEPTVTLQSCSFVWNKTKREISLKMYFEQPETGFRYIRAKLRKELPPPQPEMLETNEAPFDLQG